MKQLFANKDLWVKASVAGSLWAAFEIVIGSFLHNLHFPLTGPAMAAVGVMLLTAFSVLWKSRALIWRAGIVCALMKSLAPSAIIFGPMIGILLEALFFYAILSIFGRHAIAYVLAGMLTLQVLLLQKAANLLIVYGFDSLIVFENMVIFSLKLLSIQSLNPIHILYYAMIFLAAIGLTASLSGYYLGQRAKGIPLEGSSRIELNNQPNDRRLNSRKSSPGYHLFFAITILIINLMAASVLSFTYSLLLTSLSLVAAGCFYPNSLRILKRPSVIANLLILLLFSLFFYDYQHSGISFSINGLQVGIRLLMRATVVMAGFGIISIELHQPFVRHFLCRRGAETLYQAIQTGFSILPAMISGLPSVRDIYRNPIHSLSQKIAEANCFIQQHKNHE